MKVISAYLLACLGGNSSPSSADLKNILSSVGIEADEDRLELFMSQVAGKSIEEVIASGRQKLASVPSGGGAVASTLTIVMKEVLTAVKSRGYVEGVRLLMGSLIIVVALVAQFYPKKFPENRDFLIACIIFLNAVKIGMASYSGKGAAMTGAIYVCNLPDGTDEDMLAKFFGTIGLIKKEKRTGKPKIWLYRDKVTQEPKGDATITYEDPHAAAAAVEWFNNKEFHGKVIGVFIAESKSKDDVVDTSVPVDFVDPGDSDMDANGAGGRGRGRGDASGKAWQQDGDWLCPNTSCTNVNFAFRGVCNRCGTARPAGVAGSGGGAGRGRGRGAVDAAGSARTAAGPTGLFGPNDWSCPMCANINWAKRLKCNICNTNKPGISEGGVRGGRAGGYKELDEEELEETKRRRREAEEDDGEMYDEFGILKKKFRVKTQQPETAKLPRGSGRAGWEIEELGVADRDRERSKDRGRSMDSSRSRERDSRDRRRSRSRSRERDRGREYRDRDYDYDRERDYNRDRDRHRYR